MVLSLLSYFEHGDPRLTFLPITFDQQMPDGGWNCRRPAGATHASMNTTISVLEGLRFYELHREHRVWEVRAAQRRGREFLLAHRSFCLPPHRRNHIAGFHALGFSPRYRHFARTDYLKPLRRRVTCALVDAIDIVRGSRRDDGRWPLQQSYQGKTYFQMERLGAPSQWNTLRALRVLKWWDRAKRRV